MAKPKAKQHSLKKQAKKVPAPARPLKVRKKEAEDEPPTLGIDRIKPPKTEKKRGRGRPTEYTTKLGKEIALALASGVSLRKICGRAGMPHISTVLRWALDDEHEFCDQYARAKKIAAEILVGDIVDIADDTTKDFVTDDEGNVRVDKEHIQRSKIRIQTRQWIGVKLLPRIYGERIEVKTDSEFIPLDKLQKDRAERKKQGTKGVKYE